jgi:hypothetical protein
MELFYILLSLVGLGIFSFENLVLGDDSWNSGQNFQKKN